MKIAIIIVRVLMGLLLLFASVTYLLQLFPAPPLEGAMKTFNEGLTASVYLMPLVKVLELLCGIALVTGFFVPLALVVLFPIVVNIVCVHAFLAPEGIGAGVFLFLGTLFLAYVHRDKYKPLFSAK